MSSHKRRQRRRNYYYHRGDPFRILPVPGDAHSGPVTRAQLEEEAARLIAMGIIPAPGVPSYYEVVSPVYSFETPPGWQTSTGASILIAPNNSHGLFQVVIAFHSATSGSGGQTIRLRDSSSNVYVSTAVQSQNQVFCLHVLNHGWAVDGPLSGALPFTFNRVYSGSVSTSFVSGTLPADGTFVVDAYCSEASSAQSTLQLFVYGLTPPS
jgi:hypothetical protein